MQTNEEAQLEFESMVFGKLHSPALVEEHVCDSSAALLLLPSFCGDFPTVPPARVGHRPGSTVILAHRTPTAVVDRGWRDSRQCLDIREVTQSNWRRFGEIWTKGLTLSTPRAPKRRTHNAKPQNPSSATRCCALRTMILWYRTRRQPRQHAGDLAVQGPTCPIG